MASTIKWKKSDLQTRLEADGWTFMGNRYEHEQYIPSIGRTCWYYLPSDQDLINEFRTKGFKKVHCDTAYDSTGNELPQARAIYVKD